MSQIDAARQQRVPSAEGESGPPVVPSPRAPARSVDAAARPFDTAFLLLLLATLTLQALLRSTRGLWLDEAYTAILARRPWPGLLAALAHDNNPFLHFSLLHGWRAMFGETELALRAPSLLFALGSTLLVHRFARRTFGLPAARLAAALWVLNPLTVFYAAEARCYALLGFAALAFLTAVWEPAAPPGRWRYALLACSLPLLLYAHNVGWLVAAATLGAAFMLRPRALLRWPTVVTLMVGALAYLPWVPMFRRQLAGAELSSGWMRFFWSPWNPVFGLSAFTPFGREPAFVNVPSAPPPWWIPWLILWLLPVGWMLARRRAPEGESARFLALGVALGLVALVACSIALRPVYLPARHDFAFLAPFLLLVAAGVTALPARLGRACAAILVAVSLVGAIALQLEARSGGDRDWAAAVGEGAQAGDVVLCAGLTRPQAEYYLAGRGLTFLSFPAALEAELSHLDFGWTAAALRPDAEAVVAAAVRLLAPGRRLWVIDSFSGADEALREALASSAKLAGAPLPVAGLHLERIGAPVTLLRYVRRSRGG